MPINYLFIFILSFSFSSKIYGQMVDIEPSTCEDGIALAEENFIRGYRQALQDAEEGRKLYEENLQKETDFENVEEDV